MSIDKITPEDYNKSPEEDYWVTEKIGRAHV